MAALSDKMDVRPYILPRVCPRYARAQGVARSASLRVARKWTCRPSANERDALLQGS